MSRADLSSSESGTGPGRSGRSRRRRRTGGLDGRYWRLWGAVASSNLGDGLVSLAFPWLASLLTRDPVLIAGVALATRLPWLLFSLQAGVLGDQFDRRRLMVGANTVRAMVAGMAATAVMFDVMTLPALYLAAFVLGMSEVLFDNTTQAILPAIVPREKLERANGTIMGAQMVVADFVARPISGALVGLALSLPFAIDAVTAAISAALVASIPGTFRTKPADTSSGVGAGSPSATDPGAEPGAQPGTGPETPQDTGPGSPQDPDRGAPAAPPPRIRMRTRIAEGLRWLWGHRLLRTLALALAVMNGTSAAALATYVLFAQEILLLGGFGFGLLLAAGSVGGLLGSIFGPSLVKKLRSGPTLWLTIWVPIVTFGLTAITSHAFVVAACFAAYGFTAILWNVVTVSLRQTMIPDEILGRVNSVYRFLGWGAMPIGTILGGVLVSVVEQGVTRDTGLRAPFIAAAIIHTMLLIMVAPKLRTSAIDEAKANAPAA